VKLDPSLWLCCLPAVLLVIVVALVIGRTPESGRQDSGGIPLADDAEELNCFARLGLLDSRPDGRIDPRESHDDV